jgi:hypothetical protein
MPAMHPETTIPAPPTAVRPLGGLAAAASILIGISAIAWALTTYIAGWTAYATLARLRGESADVLGVGATGIGPIRQSVINQGIAMLVALAAAIVFIVWLSRARDNAERLSPGPMRLAKGWTAGAWFVPVANLVLPVIVVADVWHASAPPERPKGAGLVGLWWTVAVGAWLLWPVSALTRSLVPDDGYYVSAVLATVHGLSTLVAAALAVAVIQRITRWQAER